MNHPIHNKLGYAYPIPYVEYSSTDKRNRNPNWTDSEITRFLTILMEDAVLQDLSAQRNKQVFCYVSQKMASEGCEKSWDQCRVKLKNLKSQWRYVKDRIPGIETADLEDEVVVVQLGKECQSRGVSPSCIKHLRLLKRFLISLNAVRKGLSPPKLKLCGQKVDEVSDKRSPTNIGAMVTCKVEEEEEDRTGAESPRYFDYDADTGVSPAASPDASHDRLSLVVAEEDDNNEEENMVTDLSQRNILRIKSLNDINSKKRSLDSASHDESEPPFKRPMSSDEISDSSSSSAIVHKFQKEMMDRFFQYQKESEMRFQAWEQERWRMEQNLIEKWRTERRNHEKEMFTMFCGLLSDCSAVLLQNSNKK